MGPSGTASLATGGSAFTVAPVQVPCAFLLWLRLERCGHAIVMQWPSGWLVVGTGRDDSAGADPTKQEALGSGACPLGMTFGGGWAVLWCGLNLATECIGSGASWEVQAQVSCCLWPAWGHLV